MRQSLILMPRPFSCVVSSSSWHWPIILCDTRPEYPNHDYGHESEEGLEKGAVDFSGSSVTDIFTDSELKNLGNSKE